MLLTFVFILLISSVAKAANIKDTFYLTRVYFSLVYSVFPSYFRFTVSLDLGSVYACVPGTELHIAVKFNALYYQKNDFVVTFSLNIGHELISSENVTITRDTSNSPVSF